jgi:hypothetical protein
MNVVIELPPFDTGQYIGCELRHSSDAFLQINIDEMEAIVIKFSKARFIRYTAMYNCSVAMIKLYFKVTRLERSPELDNFIKNDSASLKAYTCLNHYQIYLDETGCYEFFAESVTCSDQSSKAL